MASEKIYVIDAPADKAIPADYDLLLDSSVNIEDYIEVKEKKLPGNKASFNNQENAVTKEVCVTGLLLHFSQDLAGSKLSSILGRNDIEYLNLYADTIIINDKLSFPQANVTITCRVLIMDGQGTLSTTPESNALQYAPGNGGDKRKTGATGESAGNINLVFAILDNRHPEGEKIFFANGANGQNGEMGGLKKISPKKDFPLSWTDIEKVVLKHDVIPGKTSDWKWADFDQDKKNKIYHATIQPYNFIFVIPVIEKKLGDEDLVNQDNGADAIASGPGGNGGNGGNFYFSPAIERGARFAWDTDGGEGGKSIKVEAGKKAKDSTYYHIVLRAYHKDPQYAAMDLLDFEKKFQPICEVTKQIRSVDGKEAPANPAGKHGADGKAGYINNEYHWVSPILLETMLGFAKTNYRDGERQKAKWILDHYYEGIDTLLPAMKEDMHMAALIRETELYLRKLDQNLDFYGYPPGWIPKLSALSNVNILIDSRRNLAQLIYFANDLLARDNANTQDRKEVEWTSAELKKGIKSAQVDINAAFEALPGIQNQISALEGQVKEQLDALRNLKSKILLEIEDKARAQALFTGSFEILAGICTMIPVGQPYLGQLGGGILKKIGEIDIDADNPLKEGLSFAGNLSGEVGKFIEKNKDKLKAKANSELAKEIDKGTKELNSFSDQTAAAKQELEEAENAIRNTFVGQEVALLREQIRIIRNSGAGSMNVYNMSDDYGDILGSLADVKAIVKNSKDIAEENKKTLQAKLEKLETDKGELAAKLKARKADKEKREKNVEKAGKVIKGFTDGISEISSGIQKMMVEFDEDDPAVQKKMEQIKNSKYKKEFDTIYDKIGDINKLKLPLVEKLLRFEQSISTGVQRINSNLVQWSVLSDQRVQSVQYGLAPATRATLKRIVQDSWDLLMLECYYLTKSYQYRFLKRIDPLQHGMEKFLEDIEKITKAENPAVMNKEAYAKIFDIALSAQFKKLASDLLVNVQTGVGKINNMTSVPVIKKTDKNAAGEYILERLNTHRQASFRLEDIKSSKHGTDSWLHYRIVQISFQRIVIKTENADTAFDFGIRHSGDSFIRAADRKLYYFTSRSSRNDDDQKGADRPITMDLQAHSWRASYNGADRNTPGKGLSNAVESDEDMRLLNKLLTDIELKNDYDAANKPYKDHYPGGSSELTLLIDDDSETLDFTIEELEFKVIYEVLV